ncbi:MAG: apolipoprotein N-acyltransferase [Alphaproteobacteria bacterium]|nr:apolipoprotein N-acyltransferase [Alphaproteobacteria bacterium]
MQVYVNYNDKRWKKYKIDFEKIACMAVSAVYKESEVSIILTSDSEIHALNREYRNIDKPTNVLSFELGDDLLLGDIYISLDTVKREAIALGISVEEHVAHMVIHGMLHLQGYDHIKDDEAEIMQALETKLLKKLGYKNPYDDGGFFERFLSSIKRMYEHRLTQYSLYGIFGGIAAIGFAPFYVWWTTLLGIGGAYWLTTRMQNRIGFLRGLMHAAPFGAMYAISMFWWVLHSIYVVPELAEQFAVWTIPGIIGIGLAGVIIFSTPFALFMRFRSGILSRPFIFAATWTFILWLREWFLTGFPWNPIANIVMPWKTLVNSMSIWGALGLTFIIIGGVSAIVELLRYRGKKRTWFPVLIFVLLGLIGIIGGRINIRMANPIKENINQPVIRIVQPARSQVQKMPNGRADAIAMAEKNIEQMYLLARDNGTNTADLIVYPETTYPFVITDNKMQLAKLLGKNIITGALTYSNGRMYNSMIFANQDGIIWHKYSKSHLVPFGEYSPFGIMPSPTELGRGSGPEIVGIDLTSGKFVIAPAICYEIIFSDALIKQNNQKINAIINITNDTWFGKTPGTYQHLDMVRRYAIESGVPIIRANYSGISAFIDAAGNITSYLEVGQTGILDGVSHGEHFTLYRYIGRNGWMIIILLFSICCVYGIKQNDKSM